MCAHTHLPGIQQSQAGGGRSWEREKVACHSPDDISECDSERTALVFQKGFCSTDLRHGNDAVKEAANQGQC